MSLEDRVLQCSQGWLEQQQVLRGAARRAGNYFQDLNFIPSSCEVHAPACLHQLTSDNVCETTHPAAALLPFLSMTYLAARLVALHDPC